MTNIVIAGRMIGGAYPAYLIAEIAQAHDGSLGLAHSFVDAAAEAGADAVKFQTHIADAESTLDEPFRIRLSEQDGTRYDYWKRMEFSVEQWRGLAQHAQERGLFFLSSTFSVDAVKLLVDIGVTAWKVGSGEHESNEILEEMARTGQPIIVSTGMSTRAEIDASVSLVSKQHSPFALLQCTSRYPAPLENIGLNVIEELRDAYSCPVGLSDHSGTIFPALAAMARGCDLVEAHLTFDRSMYGPDASSSLTVKEFRVLAEARDAFETMDSHPVDKDKSATDLREMRALFTKSVAPKKPLKAGTVILRDMLTSKKPGTGIPADEIQQLVGRTLVRDVHPNRLLKRDDYDG
jgi:N-acetylneuraminate synthase